MIKPRRGNIYFFMYTYSYLYDDYDYDIGFYVMVMLRSTTSPYRWPMIEVAYGEMILSLHRGYIGDGSSGRVVGVSAWCIAHVRHTRVNTSVGSMYYFPIFQYIKPMYMYIVLKIYKQYKTTVVVSDLILARRGSENVFC